MHDTTVVWDHRQISHQYISMPYLGEWLEILGKTVLKKEPDAKYSVKLDSHAMNGPRKIKVGLTKRFLVSQTCLLRNDTECDIHADEN